MRLERGDWMVADRELARHAEMWWAPVMAGALGEAALIGGLLWAGRLGGGWGTAASMALGLRVICGCIGAWSWANAAPAATFWGFRAKWLMEFLPSSALAWSRARAMRRFVQKLVEDIDGRVALAGEQENYYAKGAGRPELLGLCREMACWATAAKECRSRWDRQREAERMKSPEAREKILEGLGLGRSEVPNSILSLERLELGRSARAAEPSAEGARRL